jgi:hypothetical protein
MPKDDLSAKKVSAFLADFPDWNHYHLDFTLFLARRRFLEPGKSSVTRVKSWLIQFILQIQRLFFSNRRFLYLLRSSFQLKSICLY